jgi:hypothetical protein
MTDGQNYEEMHVKTLYARAGKLIKRVAFPWELVKVGKFRYKVSPTLTKKEVKRRLKKRFTKPLKDWLEEAHGEIEALAEEMDEWRDNMEEHFS